MTSAWRSTIWILLLVLPWTGSARTAGAQESPTPPAGPSLYARPNLVAWCIVPFDSKKRGPAERAAMVKRLGLSQVAYDWRDEHVATFEQEILEYQKQGLKYFAFWGVHDAAFQLFEKYDLHPQIWLTPPNPTAATREEQIQLSAKALLPVVERTRKARLPLGLYNHGGWGGEPENLVAVCEYLRKQHDAQHVGIVYNLHHGHDHLDRFPTALAAMKPYLLCLNLNGMVRDGDKRGQKILPLGAGELERQLLQVILDSGYRGPIGIIGHTQDDVEERLRDNLDGLDWLLPQLAGKTPGPRPRYRTPIPGATPPPPANPPSGPPSGPPRLGPGKFGQALDAKATGLVIEVPPGKLASPITVDCWTRLEAKTGFNILVASEPKASPSHWEMYSYAGTGFCSVYLPGRGGEYRTEVNIVDQQWHHVAMVYESARLRLYVDGQLALDKPLPPAPGRTPEGPTSVAVGRLVEGGIGCAGQIDELHIRRGAAPATDRPASAPAVTAETLGLWRFDSLLDGGRVKDESQRLAPATPGAAPLKTNPAGGAKVPAHWGKAQVGFEGWEEDWVDRRWQQAEVGDWLGAIVALPQGPYRKALNIRVGDQRSATVLFDTQYLALRAAWSGFLEFNPTRFGIIAPPKPAGDVWFTMPEGAGWQAERLQFRGHHVHGSRVVLDYRVDDVEVLESPW
ncbi:MAG: LamG-like jellyroll fold domain-containing protein, partial [Pirellulales bacterium]